ncbi:reverse gyrase [Archaeoglobus neptunius]|uniref:reverse gyrase n=1 Tax=Archaeoglobus neptunius TaxID=2798580 RepID=UPI001925A2BF|nr:reverse gyrase [Archaeoglobus neptunius]
MPDVLYANLCPVCGGDLSSDEIEHAVCTAKKGELCRREEDDEVARFVSFFEKCVGKPRSIQKLWAKRVLRGESFAATAPTGIGKTSFGIAVSLFLALKGKRCYLIFPTSLLVNQALETISGFAEKAQLEISVNEFGEGINIGYYHARLGKKEKEAFFDNLDRFQILITTTQFLSKHYAGLGTFNFIFVDDVDAILKASKNIDRILALLGFHYNEKTRSWKGEAKGSLMVSTATAKKGKKAELFRTLLNFDIGSSRLTVRNIEDVAVNEESIQEIEYILGKMGTGGLIYARSAEDARSIYERLKDRFKTGIVVAEKSDDFDRFARGEVDYLIGTAHYYGKLVRGLDLPERVRYAVFVGCPTFKVRVGDLDSLSLPMLRILAMIYRSHPEIERILPYIEKISREELRELVKEAMENYRPDAKDVVVRKNEILFPDIRTYIQGSGRTSRLFAGGLTKGASFLLENDTELLSAFIERARYYDIEFKKIEEVDFDALVKEVDESRERYRRKEEFDLVKPALFIVESPTKARQISRFFGRPSVKILNGAVVYEVPMERYVLMVTASIGHITDLITNRGFHGVVVNGKFVPIYASIKRCRNCGYQFTEERKSCPKCSSDDIDDSKDRINAIRKLAHDAGFIIIGTDPDTEGEKIAWDLKNLLSGCGEVKRAEFHEVTRKAVLEAFDSLREINEDLVRAQIVRRVEDRWIGFVLSQKLWNRFNNRNLSAGRAQTPVLGWIIERYRDSKEKKTIAIVRDLDLVLEHDREEFELKIKLKGEREELRIPLPPYTTETLLSDSNRILKLSVKQTMQVAQDLFENGLITYHRTDSTRVSDAGQMIAREYLGKEFSGRGWGEGGAHECIRPTRPLDKDGLRRLIHEGVIVAEGLGWEHFALYDLIFRRFMASQSKPFTVRVKEYVIEFDGRSVQEERIVEARGRAYDLYRSVWVRKDLPTGEFVVRAEIRRVPKAHPLTQAEIIQMMKERGIGRPSTYATIVDRLFARNYVKDRYGRVIPTKLGVDVYTYLMDRYSQFVSEKRTRDLENRMDAVEKGEVDFVRALDELYEEIKSIS